MEMIGNANREVPSRMGPGIPRGRLQMRNRDEAVNAAKAADSVERRRSRIKSALEGTIPKDRDASTAPEIAAAETDAAEISAQARALSQAARDLAEAGRTGESGAVSQEAVVRAGASASLKAEIGDVSLKTDFNPRQWKVNRDVLEVRQARFAALDRILGNKVGHSYGKWTDAGGLANTENMSNDERMRALRASFDSEALLYKPLAMQAASDKRGVEREIKERLAKSGVDVGGKKPLDFKIKSDGTISVVSVGEGVDRRRVEEILNSDQALGRKLLKAGAMLRAGDAAGANGLDVEHTLVDGYLRDKLGYGLDGVREGDDSIFGVDPELDDLLAGDPILANQIMIFRNRVNEFEADWSFGNGTLANRSRSADQLLPGQSLGTFAEGLFRAGGKISAYEFSMTASGMASALKVRGSNLTDTDIQKGLSDLNASLGRGAASREMENVRQAAEAAIAAHMVKNGGAERDYQAIVSVRNGKWGIRVEKTPNVPPPSNRPEMARKI